MINGILNVKKEKGMTSFDVIYRLRKIFGQQKMGHTGTLDPEAEGVLPVCMGKATRLVSMLTGTTKTYEAVLLLGVSTDTEDMTGKVLAEKEVTAGEEEVSSVIASFAGKQMQMPPMYSAVKIGGHKLVDLARKGVEVETAAARGGIFGARNPGNEPAAGSFPRDLFQGQLHPHAVRRHRERSSAAAEQWNRWSGRGSAAFIWKTA
jgi:tRNA pseudouridine55 synthase